jgi:hypothetical protein
MKTMLDGAAFRDQVVEERRAKDLIAAAQGLLEQAASLAATVTPR